MLSVKFVHSWIFELMKNIFALLAIVFVISCNHNSSENRGRIITVSIAPFKYFVEKIAGDDFSVNIMVPPGSDPHIYEPYPGQISKLRKSVAYVSNGYLGFEMTWMDRFYEINKSMVKLSLGDKIDPIVTEHAHEGGHVEKADPHFWVSLKSGKIIASSIKDLICKLNPSEKDKYESNCNALIREIDKADNEAVSLFSESHGLSFMIYHPNLAYLARDYGLKEIAVEFEGKEPPPSRLKELIDMARLNNLKTIFVQREYDSKNARAIALEVGAKIMLIDPLSENWLESTKEIINALHTSFTESQK
jgi:zinc transport system substrate-binding protein